MYELIQATESAFYIDCPSKIGLVRTNGNQVVLIDSGSDKDAAKKAKKILDSNGFMLSKILNTHSHADHIGGNRYLQEQTKCRIFASGIESDFANHPILEPVILYGGNPIDELQHKFLLAQENIAIVPLPGHSPDMVGYRTTDGALYIADCLSSKETIDKYKIGYIFDVEKYLKTLETVMKMEAKCFIPSHAEATDDIVPLCRYNIDSVHANAEAILSILDQPLCFEDVLQKLFLHYGLRMNAQQYALIGSTVRSYLTWMMECGLIEFTFENAKMLWMKK